MDRKNQTHREMTPYKSLYDSRSPFVIAEVGSTHGGDYKVARHAIEVVASTGADAIKFQTFDGEEIAADNIKIPRGVDKVHDAWLASIGNPDTLRDLLSVSGIPRQWHIPLKRYAEENEIEFISTPFSLSAAKFLVEEVGVRILKIASGDLTFEPLIRYAASCAVDILLSTGGADFVEVCRAVNVYCWPRSPRHTSQHSGIVVMECRTIYPCPLEDANLNTIALYRKSFPIENYGVGYSDHTLESWVPGIAVALGATVIEKHITAVWPGNTADSKVSMYSGDFAAMVAMVKSVPSMLGEYEKNPSPAEMHDVFWARRSPEDWLRPTEEARAGKWE